MKKLLYILLILGFLTSCAASHPGRVCGGRGGGRVVDQFQKQNTVHNKSIV
jgi:hypothetical protein